MAQMQNFGVPILAILLIISVWVTPTLSVDEATCDKYCFADCKLEDGDFSECVSANVHCNCVLKPTLRNPFMIFLIIAGVMLLMFCIPVCIYLWVFGCCLTRRGRAQTAGFQQQPIYATPSSPYTATYNQSVTYV